MSLMVWSIALLHGFAVLIVAGLVLSKAAVAIAAVVSAGVGIFVGNPIYIAIDLICVAVATYFCWTDLSEKQRLTPQQVAAAQEKKRLERIAAEEASRKFEAAVSILVKCVVAVCAMAAFFFYWDLKNSRATTTTPPIGATAVQPQVARVKPVRATEPPSGVKQKNGTQQAGGTQQRTKKKATTERHSVEKCLALQEDQAMVRCLEEAR